MFAVLFLLLVRRQVQALTPQYLPVCRDLVESLDLDLDNVPDAAKLACQFEAGGHDQAIVLDGDGDLTQGKTWEDALDFEQDTWILDYGSDGRANLIIDFDSRSDRVVASLYDDLNGDGQVSYTIVNGELEIVESDHWTIQVNASHSWMRNNRVNFNLEVLVDGDVKAMFASDHYLKGLATDGAVDFVIDVVDIDSDGRPDYEFRHHLIPERQGLVGEGFHLMVNWTDSEAAPQGITFWPYLSFVPAGIRGRFDKPSTYVPPIHVDLENSLIVAVSEFVASRSGESNCFIYGSAPLESNTIIDAGFENPFCFYDLAGDRDKVPEMEIRALYWPANDRRFLGGHFDSPIEWIRYSWDPDNDGLWDYGLGLAGRNPLESTFSLGDYTIRSIP